MPWSTSRAAQRVAIVACTALVLVFAGLSWFAVLTKSPTMDEPLHITGAFVHVFTHDDRINPEDPPLWKYWAMLLQHRDALHVARDDEVFGATLADTGYEAIYSVRALFLTPGVDFNRVIDAARFMMLLLGVALGTTIAAWGWKLGGATTALVATALYALDPNFIAHTPLVKNDVAISLCFILIALLACSVGRRARTWNVALLALACGAAAATKFSGVLAGPIVLLIFIARVAMGEPWNVFGRTLTRRAGKSLVAAGILGVCLMASALVIWASYGFRFGPTRVPFDRLNLRSQVEATKRNLFFLGHDQRYPSDSELASMPDPLIVRAVIFAERHELLPQPYLYGFLFTYQSSLVRSTYLLGRQSVVGWWYYFPLAMLFKTPLVTLAVFVLAVFSLFWQKHEVRAFERAWSLTCLSIPIFVYGAGALTTHLNLGLRHVLPLYPFFYLLVGVVTHSLIERMVVARRIAIVLLAALCDRDVEPVSELHFLLQHHRAAVSAWTPERFQSRLGAGSAGAVCVAAAESGGCAAVPGVFRIGAAVAIRHRIRSRAGRLLPGARQRAMAGTARRRGRHQRPDAAGHRAASQPAEVLRPVQSPSATRDSRGINLPVRCSPAAAAAAVRGNPGADFHVHRWFGRRLALVLLGDPTTLAPATHPARPIAFVGATSFRSPGRRSMTACSLSVRTGRSSRSAPSRAFRFLPMLSVAMSEARRSCPDWSIRTATSAAHPAATARRRSSPIAVPWMRSTSATPGCRRLKRAGSPPSTSCPAPAICSPDRRFTSSCAICRTRR